MRRLLIILFSHTRDFGYKLIFVFLRVITYLFRPIYVKKKSWLLLERGYDAQDNAWHFFKFLKVTHPEINAVFAIRKDSPDYRSNLLEYEPNIVKYGSLRYFLVLFSAEYLISTHLQTYAFFSSVYKWLSHSRFDTRAKKVFLQHGCTHNYHPSFDYPKLNVHLFIAGAKNEYDLLRSLYNYPESIVKYTGFARFDNLHKTLSRRIILIMPTWRAKYSGFSKTELEQTDFYTEYRKILTSKELINKLEEHDYIILFYNHFEFQKYNQSFEALCGDRVKLVRFGKEKVQDLLIQSQLLITDYSSVYYDFFYMKKPILFFKLNQEEFESSQYGKDYDDPNDFGYVSYSSEDMIKSIIRIVDSGCVFEKKFILNHSRVFPQYDNNNCRRIYEHIAKL